MKIKQIVPYVLVAIVSVLLFSFFSGSSYRLPTLNSYPTDYGVPAPSMGKAFISMQDSVSESSSLTSNSPRMATMDTNVVLIVKDIEMAINKIEDRVKEVGGYVVSKSQNSQIEGGYGQVNVRVARDKVTQTVNFLKENSTKVISINEYGNDITEQYNDTQARLATLYQTKTAIEQIMTSASASKDLKALIEAQKEIINIQSQIDIEKGQEKYLKEVAQTTLISAEFRTDEYALPYNPDTGWAPVKVFKNAVRSLVLFARSIGSFAIWAAVYSPVIIIGFFIIVLIKKQYIKYYNK